MRTVQIASDSEYKAALAEIMMLVEREPDRGTPEGDRLDALSLVVDAYDADRHALALEDVEAR
jgi:HTH-type transcriptional regulator / antitoxin HigA